LVKHQHVKTALQVLHAGRICSHNHNLCSGLLPCTYSMTFKYPCYTWCFILTHQLPHLANFPVWSNHSQVPAVVHLTTTVCSYKLGQQARVRVIASKMW